MNKRIFSIALVVVLSIMGCAFAQESANLAALTVATVTTVASATGAVLPADFSVAPAAATVQTQAVVDEITVAAGTGSLSTFFGEATMTAVAAAVPTADVSNLKLDEAFPLSVVNYADAYGDVTVTMRMTKDYAEGDVVVALVGIVGADGSITWMPVEATVVDGQIAVTFTQQILDAAATNELVFALLSE